MTITLNHTIVAARDKAASARFLTELFGLPDPQPFGRSWSSRSARTTR